MHSKYTEHNYYRGVIVSYTNSVCTSETIRKQEISRSFKNDEVGLQHVKGLLLVRTKTITITTMKRRDILQIEVSQPVNLLKYCKLAILPKPDEDQRQPEHQEETFNFRRYEAQPHDGYTFIAGEIEIYTCLPSTKPVDLLKFSNLAMSQRPYEALVEDQREKFRFRRYEAQPHNGFLFIAGENEIFTCMPSTNEASERVAYINAVFGNQAARGGVDRNKTNKGVDARAEVTGNGTAGNVETATGKEGTSRQNLTGARGKRTVNGTAGNVETATGKEGTSGQNLTGARGKRSVNGTAGNVEIATGKEGTSGQNLTGARGKRTGNGTAENVKTATGEGASGQNLTGVNDNCTDNSDTVGNDNNDDDIYLYDKKERFKTTVFKKVLFMEIRGVNQNQNSKSVKYIIKALTKTITLTTNETDEELRVR